MFMDISSEMIHSLLPVFVVTILGVSVTALGLLEGIAEATVNITKIFSGVLSDWSGKRKPLALAGYGMAALTKPLFPIANSFGTVFAARLLDRTGKGVRDAPRDALIADLVHHEIRGASYGLRQSLDTVGAFVGPLSAVALMLAFKGDFCKVFWISVLPAFASVGLLGFAVQEPTVSLTRKQVRPRLHWQELNHFTRPFWLTVAVGAAFTLARFSEAFLVLRSSSLGLGNDYVPLVLVVMNVVYAASSYPAGHLSDRVDRRLVLALGAITLIVADVVLAGALGFAWLTVGISLWGLHMGLSQGLLAALVADAAPAERRGTAFGLFNLINGVVLLFASLLAGVLWDHFGPPSVFYAGASFAALALLGIVIQEP
jgi:MFS family permease